MKKNISAFLRENTAAYISGLTTTSSQLKTVPLEHLTVLDSLLTFFGAIVLMLWYSPLLTAAAMLLSLLPLLASLLTGSKVANGRRRFQIKRSLHSRTARLPGRFFRHQIVSGGSTELAIFSEHIKSLAAAPCGKHRMRILVQMFGSVAGATAQLGVFLFGAWLALSGTGVTAGTTLIFVQLMNYVLSPLAPFPHVLRRGKRRGRGWKRWRKPFAAMYGRNGIRSFGDPAGHRC